MDFKEILCIVGVIAFIGIPVFLIMSLIMGDLVYLRYCAACFVAVVFIVMFVEAIND